MAKFVSPPSESHSDSSPQQISNADRQGTFITPPTPSYKDHLDVITGALSAMKSQPEGEEIETADDIKAKKFAKLLGFLKEYMDM